MWHPESLPTDLELYALGEIAAAERYTACHPLAVLIVLTSDDHLVHVDIFVRAISELDGVVAFAVFLLF